MLRALHEQMIARRAGNHVGLTPSDPEVEFGYLWSRPAAGGNRKDVSLTQQFDFPTAYVERSRLAGVQAHTHIPIMHISLHPTILLLATTHSERLGRSSRRRYTKTA